MARVHSVFRWLGGAALLCAAVPAVPAVAQSTPVLIRDARVFDGERVHERWSVLLREGEIAAAGADLVAPAGASIVEAAGMTLLPGLIDAHTHAFGDALREALVFGVTTELDMFTEPGWAATMRAEQGRGEATGRADLFSAGVLATAPGGHGTEYGFSIPTITHVDSAQAFVDARIAEGSDYIKIVHDDGALFGMSWPTIGRPLLEALVDAAHRRDRLAVVHVSTAEQAMAALDAGADGLVHLFTDSMAPAFVDAARAHGAFIIPTLVVLESITGTGGGAPLVNDSRIEPYLMPSSRTNLTSAFPARGNAGERLAIPMRTVAMLHDAGVPILAGTDAPNPGTAHGSALHRELEMLVLAGLTPVDALRAATSMPARAFDLLDRGRIAPGLRADLMLVQGDPTTSVTATRAIEGVWKGGVRVDRAAYAAEVARAENVSAPAELADGGLISDFEAGTPTARFGTSWMPNTDSFAGGTSTVAYDIIDNGADGSAKSLRVSGTITAKLSYAWAGMMWSPGNQPMQPADLSASKGVRFDTRGDGRMHRLLVFSQSTGMTPLTHEFVAPPAWSEVVVAWSALGIDGSDVMAILFVGSPPAGDFSFQVDNVELR